MLPKQLEITAEQVLDVFAFFRTQNSTAVREAALKLTEITIQAHVLAMGHVMRVDAKVATVPATHIDEREGK